MEEYPTWSEDVSCFCHERTIHTHQLSCVVTEWIGPDYQLSCALNPLGLVRFLRNEVYGNYSGGYFRGKKEILLNQRYTDWVVAPFTHHTTLRNIPSPFNLREEWYDRVLEIIKKEWKATNKLNSESKFLADFYISEYKKDEIAHIVDEIYKSRMDEVIEDTRFLGL